MALEYLDTQGPFKDVFSHISPEDCLGLSLPILFSWVNAVILLLEMVRNSTQHSHLQQTLLALLDLLILRTKRQSSFHHSLDISFLESFIILGPIQNQWSYDVTSKSMRDTHTNVLYIASKIQRSINCRASFFMVEDTR